MNSRDTRRLNGSLLLGAVALTLCVFATPTHAQYIETLGPAVDPATNDPISIASGSGIVSGGVGLFETGEGTINVAVPVGATVKQVLLYWEYIEAGADVDSELLVDGLAAQGTLVGEAASTAYTYRSDITGLGVVSDGPNSIQITGFSADIDRRDGATILVIYDDGSGLDEIFIRDGADFAWLEAVDPDGLVTVEQTFSFAASDFARTAPLNLSVGDTTPDRPDQVIVKVDGTEVVNQCNFFVGASGLQWSNRVIDVNVPAGATQVSVQLFSGCNGEGLNPESLVWIVAGFSIDSPPDDGDGCTYTMGGYKNIEQHADRWPASIGPHDPFPYNPTQSYIQVLNTSPRGDAWYILAHQYIAANNNVLNGADESDISGKLAEAEALLAANAPGNVPRSEKEDYTSLASTLDQFNNGVIGPGHCNEEEEEETAVSSLTARPNPFNPQTTISFELQASAQVRLMVYDLMGRQVAVLVDGVLPAGEHMARFDGNGLASGTYLYRIVTPTGSVTKSIVLMK